MDLLSARQRIVASNLANADTPGYRARDLEFQAEFQSFLAKAPPLAREVTGLKSRNDGNNVSVDREARLLAENAMRFSLASAMARAEVRTIRNAIQEGRGG
ncbi:MAG: flagellar biosynthesis protein FlgB [Acidobacteria bacterium]|nr:flagellar biosynthesis protein FlgB [Acidobacteriota bacterium]